MTGDAARNALTVFVRNISELDPGRSCTPSNLAKMTVKYLKAHREHQHYDAFAMVVVSRSSFTFQRIHDVVQFRWRRTYKFNSDSRIK
jgi:hypothetical protein